MPWSRNHEIVAFFRGMATPLTLPYPPLVIISSSRPLEGSDLEAKIKDRLPERVSIRITTDKSENRGTSVV